MGIKIEIATDNAAFANNSTELARILREFAEEIDGREVTEYYKYVYDVNGNKVGNIIGSTGHIEEDT